MILLQFQDKSSTLFETFHICLFQTYDWLDFQGISKTTGGGNAIILLYTPSCAT